MLQNLRWKNKIENLMDIFNTANRKVWEMTLDKKQCQNGIIDIDGKIQKTYGECKEGMDMSYKGIWGTMRELTDGSKVKVDENYIRESIEVPSAKVVKGFPPAMPPFKGMLKEKEISAIIEYIKHVK